MWFCHVCRTDVLVHQTNMCECKWSLTIEYIVFKGDDDSSSEIEWVPEKRMKETEETEKSSDEMDKSNNAGTGM